VAASCSRKLNEFFLGILVNSIYIEPVIRLICCLRTATPIRSFVRVLVEKREELHPHESSRAIETSAD
jgi:hypothetical protein